MPFTLDPEYLTAIQPFLPTLTSAPKPPLGDITSRRTGGDALFNLLMPSWPSHPEVRISKTTVPSPEGHEIPVTIFHPPTTTSSPTAGVLYCHGGGYISLSPTHFTKVISQLVSTSGVPIIAPHYRLAPEHRFPAGLNDAWTTLKWLSTTGAESLNIDPSRLAVWGDSAGGGMAAALAIRARDQGVMLKRQVLVGSMLDDRTAGVEHGDVEEFATWTDRDNRTAWEAYRPVGDGEGMPMEYMAPSRVGDVTGLADAYVEVPGLDVFYHENVEYAMKLREGGIPVELHVWTGVPHSFELFSPNISVTKLAMQCRAAVLRRL